MSVSTHTITINMQCVKTTNERKNTRLEIKKLPRVLFWLSSSKLSK